MKSINAPEYLDNLLNYDKGVYIEWSDNPNNDQYIHLSKIDKNELVVIYDRNRIISLSEYNALKNRHTVYFIEPYVIPRIGFDFWPPYIDMSQIKMSTKKRNIDLLIHCSEKSDDLNDIISYIKKHGFNYMLYIDSKSEDYSYLTNKYDNCVMNIDSDIDYKEIKFVLYIPSAEDAEFGKIHEIENILYSGSTPLIWHRHKYLHCLFRDLNVKSLSDIKWYIKIWDNVGGFLCNSMVDNINMYFPEMNINVFAENLNNIIRSVE